MLKNLEPPRWLALLRQWTEVLGPAKALALLLAAALLAAVAVSQLLISLLGFGDRVAAALCAGVSALLLAALLGRVLLGLLAQLEQSTLQLKRFSSTDMLTGIVNRRAFLGLIEREWALARRYETTCAMVMIDLDHFKRINENFGHRCGDMLLRQIAEASSETLRQGDVLARFGGEEFGLFLPHTDPLGALDVAERIRERVERLDFCWNGHVIPVSVSLGVAALQADHHSLDQFVNAAEDALHMAKADGRNCVRVGDGLMPGRAAELRA
ncbi:GGDEF domain-containing protein [Paucibacter sp. TC2R-5]|uniref:GGDEF domain-containing protein n=1 Tax=Paucibacter sp. TC2R-5 TaxID=2893555 RepID=UPI0021E431A8|nr:GGDEF domain-containing protein [Paucibacter sp. TC2R-5]